MNVACVASMGCRLVGGWRWGGESFLETSHLIELHVFESHFCETVGISDTLKMLCYDEIQCKSWWKGRFGPPHYLAWWQAFQFPLSLQPTACIWVYAKVADFFFFFCFVKVISKSQLFTRCFDARKRFFLSPSNSFCQQNKSFSFIL